MTSAAEMWHLYEFRGHRVRVIQQWRDPFGVIHVRIEADDDAAMAEGMPEAMFMRDAVLLEE